MSDFSRQIWVTTAISDSEIKRSLTLLYSLRRTITFRKIALVAAADISENFKNFASRNFDYVFYFNKKQNTLGMSMDEFAKLEACRILHAFDTCAYFSPTIIVIKNSDEIFGELDATTVWKSLGEGDTAVFLFKPSIRIYDELIFLLQKPGATLGAIIQEWPMQNYKAHLSSKYNKLVLKDQALLGDEKDIYAVNLKNYYDDKLTIPEMENIGVYEKLVSKFWLIIEQEDVTQALNGKQTFTAQTEILSMYSKTEPIAVIGVSCRLPQANNVQEFWNMIFSGSSGVTTPPEFRWSPNDCVERSFNPLNSGFLKTPIDEFDASFFEVSPKEATFMDPQHRLLLELVWEGLEDAGVNPHSLHGSEGSVFVGTWTNDYKNTLLASEISGFFRNYMGNSLGASAARISFLLGMTGPSVATESGCSSGMIAVHLACKSLRCGETNMALACGVNLLIEPFDENTMPILVSPHSLCKTFSKDANGFARAEGGGVLVLKRLSDAIKDNDNILGLIRGSGACQEGMSTSIGKPTVRAETQAILKALANANVTPDQVSYIEAHGTATPLGDSVEVAAITQAYKSQSRSEPLVIGSVKANLGHTESCSGITSIIKVLLSMKHEVIPRQINLTEINPAYDLESIPAIVLLENKDWKATKGRPRFAGVSSFGITGTDVHVILEEAPKIQRSETQIKIERPLHLLTISAKTKTALEVQVSNYLGFLRATDISISNIAYTANVGRANFPFRVAILGGNADDMVKSIEQKSYQYGDSTTANPGKVCFLFTGQGSQYAEMAKTVYDTSPVFRMHFDYCSKALERLYNVNLLPNVIWSSKDNKLINQTVYSQTSIFCVEYALFKLWESWGIMPDYVLGHSLGEFAAAVCAGVLSIDDAIKLVAERSKLVDNLPQGQMLVCQAEEQEIETLMLQLNCTNKMDIAAINSKSQIVVSGDSNSIQSFKNICKKMNIKCTVLNATHAFHSYHMDSIIHAYRNIALTTTINTGNESKCGYISGVTGNIIGSDVPIDADYWMKHLRDRVNFLSASKKAVECGCTTFIEIGPQPILSAMVLTNTDVPVICVPSLKRKASDWSVLLQGLAKLYTNGSEINWNGFHQFHQHQKVQLPFYPFERKRYWPELVHLTGNVIHPLIGTVILNALPSNLFQSRIDLKHLKFLKDHVIGNIVVMPGACFLEMCIAAGVATIHNSLDKLNPSFLSFKLVNFEIQAPLGIKNDQMIQLQTVAEYSKHKGNNYVDENIIDIKIYQKLDNTNTNKWLQHASGKFVTMLTFADQDGDIKKDFVVAKQTVCSNANEFYKNLESVGLHFGESFKSLDRIWRNPVTNSLLAEIKFFEIYTCGQRFQNYLVHPVLLDAMLQAIMYLNLTGQADKRMFVPVRIGEFVWYSRNHTSLGAKFVHVAQSTINSANTYMTAFLLDANGNVLCSISDVEFSATLSKTVESVISQQISPLPGMWDLTWSEEEGFNYGLHKPNTCREFLFHSNEFKAEINGIYNVFTPDLKLIDSRINKLGYLYIMKCFYECGFLPTENAAFETEELRIKLGIKKEFAKLFRHFLCICEGEGILQNSNTTADIWTVVKQPPSLHELAELVHSRIYTVELMSALRSTSLLVKLGENMKGILTGAVAALPIILHDGSEDWFSANDLYEEHGQVFPYFNMIQRIMKQNLEACRIQHQAAGETYKLRICEVGAGTGAATSRMIQVLEQIGIEYEYTFTDVTSAFFTAAEKMFQTALKHIKFKTLDLEKDPLAQGFIPAYYDLVIALEVCHATRNLRETLCHINTLLKVDGRFEFGEITTLSNFLACTFGFLNGFWRFEDHDIRKHVCVLSASEWEELLRATGFDLFGAFSCMENQHTYFSSKKTHDISAILDGNLSLQSAKLSSNRIWILFHEPSSKLSQFLVNKMLTLASRKIVLVVQIEKLTQTKVQDYKGCISYYLNSQIEDDFIMLLNTLNNLEDKLEGILYCWPLISNQTRQQDILKPFLYLSKAVLKLSRPDIKFIVLTNSVSPVAENNLTHFHSSTLVSFIKSMCNEQTDLNCRSVDVGNSATESEYLGIFYELWIPRRETHAAYAGTSRYVPKISKSKTKVPKLNLPPGIDRFCIQLPESKTIEDLEYIPLEPFLLEKDEIEIQVNAFGLNYLDVVSVLRPTKYFEDHPHVGLDFSGTVKRVGPDVTKWKLGDNVIGLNFGKHAFPSHIKKNENNVFKVPADMTFSEASTLPVVFATNIHSLVELAKVKQTDTVLIHSASGGVGLSAIQICQNLGATVIATAGSMRKQRFLKSLGIYHVFYSRNINYEEEIMKATNNRGVDVVLNSLTSKGFKEATLKCCATGARFLELGKLSIWTPDEVKKLRPDVEYYLVDLAQFSPSELQRILLRVEEFFKTNPSKYEPIPCVRFCGLHIRDALRYLQKANHIGKVVCVMPRLEQPQVITPLFHDNVTYLITGGLGGIGFVVCEWMLKKGAKYIVLAGRNLPTKEKKDKIDSLNDKYNARVLASRLDVTDFEDCRNLIEVKLADIFKYPSLRGIMHCAGILQPDTLVEHQHWENFELTLGPKVTGTLNLHKLTARNYRLEHFVLFSSITSIFGTPKQANYAAGNKFEDTFAHYRYSIGLPATSINWGAWGEVGIATDIDYPGMKPLSNLQCGAGLEHALRNHLTQLGIFNLDSLSQLSLLYPHILHDFEDELANDVATNSVAEAESFWKKYDKVSTLDAIHCLVCTTVKDILKNILKMEDTDSISHTCELRRIGVDSLMLVELKNALQILLRKRLVLNAGVFENCDTVEKYAKTIVELIEANCVGQKT